MNEERRKNVIHAIVRCCESEEEIREILADLVTFDWRKPFAEKRYENSLRPCTICGEWLDCRTFRYVLEWMGSGVRYMLACVNCFNNASFTCACIVCGIEYKARMSPANDLICSHCGTVRDLIQRNNSRARCSKGEATLTIQQWKETLQYFQSRCAYCGGEYECLEHYLPLSLKGGTVASNCVPACYRCNNIKSNRHPDTFDDLFPTENLERIRSWLYAGEFLAKDI